MASPASCNSNPRTLVVDVAPSSQVVQAVATLGTLLPLHASAGGKALLATSSPDDPVLRGPLTRFTSSTVVDPAALAAELDTIRERGWAHQSREFDAGVSSVAAAIQSVDGGPAIAAVVLFGPANRLTPDVIERVAPLVVHAASEVSRRLFA